MLRSFVRALFRRCPRCGDRKAFSSWMRLREACPRCDHYFERQEGYWLGAIAINTVVTGGLFVAVMVIWASLTWPEPPWTAITIGTVALNIVFPVAFYPISKTLWVALELTLHPAEPWDGDR